jgi:hypothetical protein
MRKFTAAGIGLIGILVSQAAMAQDNAPPPGGEAAPPPPPEGTPPPAVAAPGSPGSGGSQFGSADGPGGPSVWGILPWGGFGAGGRYMLPIGITHLLSKTRFRDYWALEFGADILRYSYDYVGVSSSYSWTEIIPVVGMMWQVWFNDNFAVYPKIEAGYAIGWYSGTMGSTSGLSGGNHIYPGATAGILYKLDNGITLRAEAGYVGAKLGVAWLF